MEPLPEQNLDFLHWAVQVVQLEQRDGMHATGIEHNLLSAGCPPPADQKQMLLLGLKEAVKNAIERRDMLFAMYSTCFEQYLPPHIAALAPAYYREAFDFHSAAAAPHTASLSPTAQPSMQPDTSTAPCAQSPPPPSAEPEPSDLRMRVAYSAADCLSGLYRLYEDSTMQINIEQFERAEWCFWFGSWDEGAHLFKQLINACPGDLTADGEARDLLIKFEKIPCPPA